MHVSKLKNRRGQTMIEYIIIVVLIAIGGMVLYGILGDTLKKKTSGAISSLDSGEEASDAQDAASENSRDTIRDLEAEGIQ